MNDPEQPLLLNEMHGESGSATSENKPEPEIQASSSAAGVTGIHISPSSSPVPGVVPSSVGIRSRTPQINSGWL